jgi:perosamine synthetase
LSLIKPDPEAYFFAHARTALWYGLQQLPVEREQTMLVPEYVCEVILHPLEDLGIRVLFYPVDDSFIPDWEVLETLIYSEPVHAFLLVHYFGQPQDIERAQEFCDQHGLWLIEDNAHGHGGNLKGRPLGSFGELGFSSPRKQLRSPSGGMLYLHGEPVDQTTRVLPGYPVSREKEFLLFLVRPFPRIRAGLLRMLRPEPDFSDPSAFPEIRMEYQSADPDSVRRILAENWPNHATSRREAWKAWSNFSLENGLQPVWEKPHPESCPWAIPVYVSDLKDRLHWLRWGRRKGLNFFPWPTLPESVLQSSPSAVDRWQSLLCFPLDQRPKVFH